MFPPRSVAASLRLPAGEPPPPPHPSALSFPNSPAPPPSQPPTHTAATGHAAQTSRRQSTQSILRQQPPAAVLLPGRSDRVDPPAPVNDTLLSWAHEAHWSMGGLSAKRLRLVRDTSEDFTEEEGRR
jgi:hypothetical protein